MTDRGRLSGAWDVSGLARTSGTGRDRGAWRLGVAIALAVLVWGVFLPGLTRWDMIRRHIDRNEELGIDPGAKYYTEQPNAALWHERVQQRLRASTPRE